MRGSPRGSDRDAGQVVGRRLASSNAAEGDATEASRSRRKNGAARAGELRREVVQPFKSTRPARGLSSGSQPRDVRGASGSTGVESMPLFSLLSRGKQSPWDGVDAPPRRKKRRELIVGCPLERTPRVRGVPRLTRRRWARF